MNTCPIDRSYERSLDWLCAQLASGDPDRDDDLLVTARVATASAGPFDRMRELASLAALVLRRRAYAALARRGGTWLGGVRIGVLALLVLFAVSAVAPYPFVAPVAAVAAAALWWFTRRADLATPITGFALLVPVARLAGAEAVAVAVTLVAPALLLALARYDPRYGAAAATLWAWRFIASDPGQLVAALAGLADRSAPFLLLTRYLVMSAGVVVAIAVTRCSAHRIRAL